MHILNDLVGHMEFGGGPHAARRPQFAHPDLDGILKNVPVEHFMMNNAQAQVGSTVKHDS